MIWLLWWNLQLNILPATASVKHRLFGYCLPVVFGFSLAGWAFASETLDENRSSRSDEGDQSTG